MELHFDFTDEGFEAWGTAEDAEYFEHDDARIAFPEFVNTLRSWGFTPEQIIAAMAEAI